MRRLLCVCIVLVITFLGMMTSVNAADSYLELDGFTFDINENGEATIHDYDDSNTDVIIPEKLLRAPVVYIDDYAFYRKSIINVNLEKAKSLVSIGSCSFYGCSLMEKLFIPEDVILSFGAFQGCTGLVDLTISEGVDTIPEQCFYQCSSLFEIVLPDSVKTIETRAFSECTGLRSIYLSENVESIADNAFQNDPELIIYCKGGTYAEQYALAHGFKIIYVDTLVLGDVDGDGQVTIIDTTCIQQNLVRLLTPVYIEEAADTDVDGEVTIADATYIQRWLANLPSNNNIGKPVS